MSGKARGIVVSDLVAPNLRLLDLVSSCKIWGWQRQIGSNEDGTISTSRGHRAQVSCKELEGNSVWAGAGLGAIFSFNFITVKHHYFFLTTGSKLEVMPISIHQYVGVY